MKTTKIRGEKTLPQKRLTLSVVIISFLWLMAVAVYADATVSERKKQIRRQENIVKNNSKSRAIEIKDGDGLDDYIRAGLKNNPGLKASFYDWKSAFSKIPQAFSLPDPQFTYTDYINAVETRVGPQEKAYSINQKFPLLDKLWIRRSKAFKSSEEAFHKFNKRRFELINQITDAYYEYAYLDKAVRLMKDNIRLLMNFERVAQSKYKTGMVQNHDLLKVQVELGRLENELLSLEDLRFPLCARLNSLLYLPKDNLLPWPDETLEDVVMENRYEEISGLYDELTDNNPELLSLTVNVAKNEDAVKLSKRDYLPDVVVGVTRIYTGDALMPNTVDSGKDPLMVMVSVNIPIWFNRLNAGGREAKASLKSAESLLENKKNELSYQLALTHYKVRDALRQSQLYKDALLPKAAQTLNATQAGYEGGKADFLSLIDAQRVLLNFQLAFYRQNANFHQRLAALKSLIGELQTDAEWEGLVSP